MTATTAKDKLPFVLFDVGKTLYAISAEFVREILLLPKVTGLPNMPPEIRGVINLRGNVLKLVDLHVKLSVESAQAELDKLIQLLHDREQDHRNWLKELEACVRERRPFNLARDPHKCKFGQWYDSYRSDDSTMGATFFRMALKKMEVPHRMIHACADEVLQKADEGHFDEAFAILENKRNNELATMINLFEESRRLLKEARRELVIVVRNGVKNFALSVDAVQSVENIPQETIEPVPASLAGLGGVKCHVAQRAKTRQTVLLLGPEFLFPAGLAA